MFFQQVIVFIRIQIEAYPRVMGGKYLVWAQNNATAFHLDNAPFVHDFPSISVDPLPLAQRPRENDPWLAKRPDGFSDDGPHVRRAKSGVAKRLVYEFRIQSDYLTG